MSEKIPNNGHMNWSVGAGNYSAQRQLDYKLLSTGVLIKATDPDHSEQSESSSPKKQNDN